jgi:hypothetical protein
MPPSLPPPREHAVQLRLDGVSHNTGMTTGSVQRFAVLLCLAVGAAACTPTPPPAPPPGAVPAGEAAVKVQGELTTEGVECQALRAEDGTLYTLLGDLKDFKAGDPVIVVGTPVQISLCMQGTTIQVSEITRRPPR